MAVLFRHFAAHRRRWRQLARGYLGCRRWWPGSLTSRRTFIVVVGRQSRQGVRRGVGQPRDPASHRDIGVGGRVLSTSTRVEELPAAAPRTPEMVSDARTSGTSAGVVTVHADPEPAQRRQDGRTNARSNLTSLPSGDPDGPARPVAGATGGRTARTPSAPLPHSEQ